MQKIDRLGWANGISFLSYGLKIGVRVNVPDVLPQVLERLPPGWQPASSPLVDHLYSLRIGRSRPGDKVRQFHLLYMGLQRLARDLDLTHVLDILESDVQMLVAEQARERVFVHAGVVSWRGRVILLPGRSFAGKSTLVKALVQAGATYHSDEYAVLDNQGMVHPYPRRLALRQPDSLSPRRVSAEELGGVTGSAPLPVGLVALTKYRPGARWRPQPVTPGKAMMELLNNTVAILRQPEKTLSVLHQAIPWARFLKGFRGEAEEMAESLLQAAA